MIEKIELKGTYGYKNFITNEEKQKLLEWIDNNEDKFISYHPNRKSFKFENETSVDYLITEIKNRIINLEYISNWKKEPRYLDYIAINSKNGSIPLHFDANDGNFIHTRYNVILSYPEKGGESIYGDNINILEENMVWKCVAGKIKHGSTLVESDKRRITFSLGFLIENSNI